MELGGEPGVGLVADALVGAVVHIHEKRFPFGGQSISIHRIAVVLRSDKASVRAHHPHGLVVAAMTVFQFVGLGSSGTRQQLIAQTNAHKGLHFLIIQEGADMLHRLAALLWVAWSIPLCPVCENLTETDLGFLKYWISLEH